MTPLNSLIDVKIIFIIFIVAVFISIFLCLFIILLIIFTKTLHSPVNLLLCNTSLAIILYFIISLIKTSLFYNESTLSHWWCRILAYIDSVFLSMIYYSFVIQALSRLFFIVFHRHRHLLEYKFHIILIISQILISFLISLSILVTEDVVFRPSLICWVPTTKIIHIIYLSISTYLAPFFIIIIVYGIIYCRVIRSSTIIRQSSHVNKRDIELIKNILILSVIFIIAGVPTLIVTIVFATTKFESLVFYLFPVVVAPFVAIIERICLIHLNKEIRKETKKLLGQLHIIRRSNQVTVLAYSATHATNIAVH